MLGLRRTTTLPLGLDIGASTISLVASELRRDGFVVKDALSAPIPACEPAALDRTIADTLRALLATTDTRERRCVLAAAHGDVVTRLFRMPPGMSRSEAERAAAIEADGLVPWPTSERLLALDQIPGRPRELLLCVGRNSAIERLVTIAKAANLRPVAVDAPVCAWRRALPKSDALLDWSSERATLTIFGDPLGTTQIFAPRLIDERLVAQIRTAFVDARRDGLADVQTIAVIGDADRYDAIASTLGTEGYAVERVMLGGEVSPTWAFAYGLATWSVAPRGIRAA